MNTLRMLKQPSAFLPVAMSFAALALLLGHLAIYGIVRGGDEGASAHLFQLLIVAQVPIVAYFSIRWLPKTPKQAIGILALQVGAAILALAPVFYFDL
jgi:hypothetical protein